MNMIKLIGAIALAGIGAAAQAAVTANLSSQQIGAGESVQFDLRSDARHGGLPDLAPLQRDFRVLGSSSGSSIQVINGSMSITSQVQIVLQPKHAGVLPIPSLRWDDETTPALSVAVSAGVSSPTPPSASAPGSGSDSDSGDHIRVEAALAPGPLYVGGAALLTVRILTDQPLVQAGLDVPANADLGLEQIGADQQISDTRNGYAYQGIVRHYLVRPQRSGALVVKGPVLTAQVEAPGGDPFNDPMFSRMFGAMRLRMPGALRTIHVQAKDMALDVRPRPQAADAKDWLPATSLSLTADAGPASALHVGDPLTLHLHLRATGTSVAQLPDLGSTMTLPDGIKAYPEQAKLDVTLAGSVITASRDQDVAVIASRPGRFILPAISVRWWDVTANVARVAEVPARVIDVLPAAAAPAPAPMPVPVTPPQAPAKVSPFPWTWAGAGLALLLFVIVLAWWRRRARPAPAQVAARASRRAPQVRPDDAMRTVRASAAANDADATRRGLLALAGATWPAPAPAGLHALAAHLPSGPLRQEVDVLDRACYTGAAWTGAALVQALEQWPQAATKTQRDAGIADLYL